MEEKKAKGEIRFDEINISDLISLCLSCETENDAENVMKQYEQYCDTPEIAHKNLGYMFGYCSEEDRKKLYDLFLVSHPIFGSGFGRGKDITPEEAYKKGEEVGKIIAEGTEGGIK